MNPWSSRPASASASIREARILPLDGSALPVRVTVHTQGAAEGTVSLKLPRAGAPIRRRPTSIARRVATPSRSCSPSRPLPAKTGAYSHQGRRSVSGDRSYESGWQSVGYPGLRPYNIYRTAELQTRKVDVKLAPGLRIGYVMGPGDLVPEALEGMGDHASASFLSRPCFRRPSEPRTSSSSESARTPSVPSWPKSSLALKTGSAAEER